MWPSKIRIQNINTVDPGQPAGRAVAALGAPESAVAWRRRVAVDCAHGTAHAVRDGPGRPPVVRRLVRATQAFHRDQAAGRFRHVLRLLGSGVLGTLVGQADVDTLHVKGAVLDEAQRQMLFGGLTGWWYWDRNGGLHRIEVGTDSLH